MEIIVRAAVQQALKDSIMQRELQTGTNRIAAQRKQILNQADGRDGQGDRVWKTVLASGGGVSVSIIEKAMILQITDLSVGLW